MPGKLPQRLVSSTYHLHGILHRKVVTARKTHSLSQKYLIISLTSPKITTFTKQQRNKTTLSHHILYTLECLLTSALERPQVLRWTALNRPDHGTTALPPQHRQGQFASIQQLDEPKGLLSIHRHRLQYPVDPQPGEHCRWLYWHSQRGKPKNWRLSVRPICTSHQLYLVWRTTDQIPRSSSSRKFHPLSLEKQSRLDKASRTLCPNVPCTQPFVAWFDALYWAFIKNNKKPITGKDGGIFNNTNWDQALVNGTSPSEKVLNQAKGADR